MILTVEEFQTLNTSAVLEDEALQLLLDATEVEIVAYAGSPETAQELFGGGHTRLVLGRAAASITSITETVGTTVTTLAADDYLLYPGGSILLRLNTGTNPRSAWHGRISVTSVPLDDEALRKAVQAELVTLALNYKPGVTQETVGAWTRMLGANKTWNQDQERATILARLSPGPSMVVV